MSNPLIRKIAGRGGIGFLDRLLPGKSRRAKQFHSVPSGRKILPLSHFRVARSLCCLRSPSGCGHSMAMCLRYSARPAAGLRPLPFSLLPSVRPCAPPLRASGRPPVLFLAPAAAPVLADSARPSAAFSWAGTSISPSSPRKNAVQGHKKSGAIPGSTRIAPHSVRIILQSELVSVVS